MLLKDKDVANSHFGGNNTILYTELSFDQKAPGQLVQLKKIYDLSDKNHIGNLQQ